MHTRKAPCSQGAFAKEQICNPVRCGLAEEPPEQGMSSLAFLLDLGLGHGKAQTFK